MDLTTGIIIVNFKTQELTIDCINSLQSAGALKSTQVLIIDNQSRDDSVSEIKAHIELIALQGTLSLYEKSINRGFSAGNNLGVENVSSEYLLLLNSDTLVRPCSVELLVKTLRDNSKLGVAGPRLECGDGVPLESCFRSHRPVTELIRIAASGPVTKLLKRYEVPLSVSDELSYPEWTSLVWLLIRRQIFEDIGLLDEELFMYFEDVDSCQRARRAGWNIIYSPNARAVHLRGGSSPVKSQTTKKKRLPWYFYESRTRYYYKYVGRPGLLAADLFWHLGWPIARVRKLFNSSYQPNICESQWRDIWTNFRNPTAAYIHPDNC